MSHICPLEGISESAHEWEERVERGWYFSGRVRGRNEGKGRRGLILHLDNSRSQKLL